MSARASVYSLLVGDTTLSALGYTASTIYPSQAPDTPSTMPFIVLRWEEQTSRWGIKNEPGKQVLTIWCHDKGGSYDRINAGLNRVKEILEVAVHVDGADGVTLTQADWRGNSADLYDDGFKTITRNSAYDVVSRQTEGV